MDEINRHAIAKLKDKLFTLWERKAALELSAERNSVEELDPKWHYLRREILKAERAIAELEKTDEKGN